MFLTKVLLIITLGTLNLFSLEISEIQQELNKKYCNKYTSDEYKSELNGIYSWIESIDKIKKCDQKSILLHSSKGSLSTIDSNILLLKKQYHYCTGITELHNAIKLRKSKVLKMKQELNGLCKDKSEEPPKTKNIDEINYLEKIEILKQKYIKNKETLKVLQQQYQKLIETIQEEKKRTDSDDQRLMDALNNKKNLKSRINKTSIEIKSFEASINSL